MKTAMIMQKHSAYVWIPITLLNLTACGAGVVDHGDEMLIPQIDAVELAPGEPLRVVATTNIIGDVVANVGGDALVLAVLIPPGQDPHGFEPVATDLALVSDAHVIFVNGLGLEEALLGTIESSASGVIVPVSAGIEPLVFAEDEHGHEGDPHFWMDPNNVIVWVQNIEATLSAADPDNAAIYAENAAAYSVELQALDTDIRAQVETIPIEERKLVTDHDTLGYFADEYGFELVGAVIPGTSTSAQPSAGEIAALVEVIRAEDVPAIFVGRSAGERIAALAETISEEVGGDVQILTLYTGSIDADDTGINSYLSMMRYNSKQIVKGLTE